MDEYLTGCKLEGGLQGIGKAVAKVRPGDEAVNDDLDVMDALGVYLGNLINGVDGAVNPDAGESSGAGVINDRLALTLASAPDRGKQDQARAGGQGGDGVNHLRDGLRLDATTALGAVGNTDAGVEEAQVIVDFGDGADGRSWVARYGLLVDGDGGRKSINAVDIGLVKLAKELAGVGREAFDEASLALGEDGVEREGRLARTGQAGDDDQLVSGQVDIDVLEIVGACTADRNDVRWCDGVGGGCGGVGIR